MTGRLLVYSFVNNPYRDRLSTILPQTMFFHQLKADLKVLLSIVDNQRITAILGVADSKRASSCFESKAVNKFHKKTISSNADYELKLDIPSVLPPGFHIRQRASTTFCNWTMFKIRTATADHGIPFYFTHCHSRDVDKLKTIDYSPVNTRHN